MRNKFEIGEEVEVKFIGKITEIGMVCDDVIKYHVAGTDGNCYSAISVRENAMRSLKPEPPK